MKLNASVRLVMLQFSFSNIKEKNRAFDITSWAELQIVTSFPAFSNNSLI